MAPENLKKHGRVYVGSKFAGTIEDHEGYCIFTYSPDYLKDPSAKPVSLTLPLTAEPYKEKVIIPFFDGLIPEGWLLNIITENWKINPRDRMSLLFMTVHDCIGNVSVVGQGQVR